LNRKDRLQQLQSQNRFDVVVLGGGINGACLYDTLCRQGYRVLLVEKNDFSSGTSQSSGMMIWGGLLYLRNFDLPSVFQLSYDRDQIIRRKPDWAAPTIMRYLPSARSGRPAWWVQSGLWFYWLMAMGRRRRPRSEASFDELALIKPDFIKGSISYEEAFLEHSDARFVFHWIASHQSAQQIAINYCQLEGAYSASDKRWHLDLVDAFTGNSYQVQAAMVVNCTGVWTDQVNAHFDIKSPYRHAFSKGVYLGLPRDRRHQSSLFFELGEHDDVITHVPWGPISMWGPTETAIKEISEGVLPLKEDIDFLLEHYERRYRKPISRCDIVSLRCGIRPLVVDSSYQSDRYPLDLSRRQEVIQDSEKPWISCYGGKITGCTRMASKALQRIKKTVAPTGAGRALIELESPSEWTTFPGLSQALVSAAWCAEHELCCTLEDYLRRRTNIAQWVRRGGLGENDSNMPALQDISLQLAKGDASLASQLLENYRAKIAQDFDPLLQA
jgi:glycerol-3-phosphate dehydrogenase